MHVDERIKNIKIYVDGKSADIQKALFALGAEWRGDKKRVINADQPFLFTDSNGAITYGWTMDVFVNKPNKEVSAAEVLSWKPKHELKPFDRVLVRDETDQVWGIDFFEKKSADDSIYFCLTQMWDDCIPYEGNEHLLGTTDSPEE